MSPVWNAVLIIAQLGLLAGSAEFARRAQAHAIDARYEAEFAKRCAARARAAARYCRDAVAHLEANAGVRVPTALRLAWGEVGIGDGEHGPFGAPPERGPKTPA